MRRIRLLLLPLLILALALGACGSASTRTVTEFAFRGEGLIPKAAIKAAPESARVPEGAKGAARDRTQFANGPIASFLIGSQIQIDAGGAALIERFEEVQKSVYCPYWDAYGHVWTRGFGETDWSGNFGGRCISHRQAVQNLINFVNVKYLPVIRSLRINLTHHEIGALASVVWNLGPGVISGSIRYDLQHHLFSAAWNIIVQYVHAGGVTLPGLVTRRYAERAYFFTPDPAPKPLTSAQRRAITGRIEVLRRELRVKGCDYRRKHHVHLGRTCTRWFSEGHRLYVDLKVNHL